MNDLTVVTEDPSFDLGDGFILTMEQFGIYYGVPIYHHFITRHGELIFHDETPEHIKEKAKICITQIHMRDKLLISAQST